MSEGLDSIEHMFEIRRSFSFSAGTMPDLAGALPSAQLASTLERFGTNVDGASDAELFDALQAWSRMESWVAAQKAEVIAALAPDDSMIAPDGYHLANTKRELVAVALNIAPQSASNEVNYSHHLVGSCKQTNQALTRGEITSRCARVIAEETMSLDDEQIETIENHVLENAAHRVPSRVARDVRRKIHSLMPKAEAKATEGCKARRSVRLTPCAHGMAIVEAYLPAPEAVSLYNTVSEIARINKERDKDAARRQSFDIADLPQLDAYRADSLSWLADVGIKTINAEVAQSGLSDPTRRLGLGKPERYQAHIVMDIGTALGLADNPAELSQYGPFPGHMARLLAADVSWEAWVKNASGQLQVVGSKVYQPAPSLRRFILNRDQVCQFPGCSVRAVDADIDHSKPYDKGGSTSVENLHCLCRRHHRMKTHAGWATDRTVDLKDDLHRIDHRKMFSPPNGTSLPSSTTWNLPTGHKISNEVESVLPEPLQT